MAENENVIVVDNVTKNFKVYLDKGQSFKERLLGTAAATRCATCCGASRSPSSAAKRWA